MYSWINDAANGLIKEKTVNEITMRAKFLPPEYLTYKELQSIGTYSDKQADSLLLEFEDTYSFLLTVEFDKARQPGSNALFHGVNNYQDYKQRIEELNFHLSDYISLETSKGTFAPVLWNLENTYNVGNSRNIYLVFADEALKELPKQEKLDLTFHDNFFNTGINHFVFDHTRLTSVPEINFWKYN